MVTEQMKPVTQSKHGPFVCSAIEQMNRWVFYKFQGTNFLSHIPIPVDKHFGH